MREWIETGDNRSARLLVCFGGRIREFSEVSLNQGYQDGPTPAEAEVQQSLSLLCRSRSQSPASCVRARVYQRGAGLGWGGGWEGGRGGDRMIARQRAYGDKARAATRNERMHTWRGVGGWGVGGIE